MPAPLAPVVFSIAGGVGADSLTALPGGSTIGGFEGADTLIGLGGADALVGGAGNDSLAGGLGADSLWGEDGADTLDGGNGNDLLSTGAGADSASGGEGNDTVWGFAGIATATLAGGNGNDAIAGGGRLLGEAGADSLAGDLGADTLDGGSGADTMAGGGGDDTYVVDNAGDRVLEGSGNGFDQILSSVSYNLAGQFVERVVLTGGSAIDAIGNSQANVLIGNGASNLLQGLGGNDSLEGGAGADTLDGGTDADTMAGGAGDDTYVVDNLADRVLETSGNGTDEILSSITWSLAGQFIEKLTLTGASAVNAIGNSQANQLTGNVAPNRLQALDGADTLDGGASGDTMEGGAGDDTYVVDNAGDRVFETSGNGNDQIFASATHSLAGQFVEKLVLTGGAAISAIGNSQANHLVGNGAANRLIGLDGADTLDGGAGGDTLDGGAGNDTHVVDNAADRVIETNGNGTDQILSSVSWNLAGQFVEKLTLTGGAAIEAIGNSQANQLVGNAAANRLDGLGGADTLEGGAGDDTYVVDNVADRVIEANGNGFDEILSSISWNLTGQFVERLTLTGAAAISGIGNGIGNHLVGNGAANRLQGLEGADTLDGGGGADTMEGGTGNDIHVVDNAGDRVIETSGNGTDEILASVTYNLAGQFVEKLTLTGGAAIDAIGNSQANQLVGNVAANLLDGLGGADTMEGGAGDDSYVVDTAGDRVIEANGNGFDEIFSLVSYSLAGQFVEKLTLTGAATTEAFGNSQANHLVGNDAANLLTGLGGADTLDGGGGADILLGGDHADLLGGNAGADTLEGGAGADTLTGGDGNDAFRYETQSQGTDLVTDFVSGFDRIEVRASGFGSISSIDLVIQPGLTVDFFAPAFILDDNTNTLWFEPDGAGPTAPTPILAFPGPTTLFATDFWFY